MAHTGQHAVGNEPDLGHGLVKLGRGTEDRHPAMAETAGGDAGGELEVRALVDHRQVLVLRDLADADDGDLLWPFGVSLKSAGT